MVKGLAIFKKYFSDYTGSYEIIGGTARDIHISEAAFEPKGTKDIDIILLVEAINPDFVVQFWKFINEGGYERKEESAEDRKYYRFTRPANAAFPGLIELFARKPDVIILKKGAHLTPIPAGEGLTSLSAILVNDDYYNYLMEHSSIKEDLHLANPEILICLKAKAFLEISDRIANGSKEEPKLIKKHKEDIFRLSVLLTAEQVFELPGSIKKDLQQFANIIAENLPGNHVFDDMGMVGMDAGKALLQLIKNFNLDTE